MTWPREAAGLARVENTWRNLLSCHFMLVPSVSVTVRLNPSCQDAAVADAVLSAMVCVMKPFYDVITATHVHRWEAISTTDKGAVSLKTPGSREGERHSLPARVDAIGHADAVAVTVWPAMVCVIEPFSDAITAAMVCLWENTVTAAREDDSLIHLHAYGKLQLLSSRMGCILAVPFASGGALGE